MKTSFEFDAHAACPLRRGSRSIRLDWAHAVAVSACFVTAGASASSWTDITPPQLGVAPTRIGLDPSAPLRLFVGSWGDGLFVSSDGGESWQQRYSDFFEAEGIATTVVIQAVVSGDASNAGVAITASGSYYSVNGGGSWQRHPANDVGDSPAIGFVIERIPDGSGVVASEGAYGLSGGTFWIFDWSTLEWTVGSTILQGVDGASTLALGFDASDPPVLTVGNTFRCFWTDDLGTTLNNNAAGLSDNVMRAVAGDPEIPGRVVAAVEGGLFLQTSPGSAWAPHGGVLPGPVVALIHHPADPEIMFAGTPAGVYRSDDRGASWTPMTTDGMAHVSIFDLAIHPDRSDVLVATASDGTPGGGGVYAMVLDGVVAAVELDVAPRPRLQSVPNPFRALTRVRYELSRAGRAHLAVYDVSGRRVALLVSGEVSPGAHSLSWDGRDARGRDLASGVYYYRLALDGVEVERRTVTLMR